MVLATMRLCALTDPPVPCGRKKSCVRCFPSRFCAAHERRKAYCGACGGASMCAHGRRREVCGPCGGRQVCAHGRRVWVCALCGGSQICAHGWRRNMCAECGGSQICMHNRRRDKCHTCSPAGFAIDKARKAVARALRLAGVRKTERTHKLLGCSAAEFCAFLARKIDAWNETFEEQIDFANMACDHIKPLSSGGELAELMHYTNIQPLPRTLNLFKSNKWSAHDDAEWRTDVLHNSTRTAVFWPRACGPISALWCTGRACE